jgi:hypothetical protein
MFRSFTDILNSRLEGKMIFNLSLITLGPSLADLD